MEKEIIIQNANCLESEFQWLEQVLDVRLQAYFESATFTLPMPPDLSDEACTYALFLKHYAANAAERIVLLLCLAPYLKPQLLDTFFAKNKQYDRGFTEFGGILGQQHSGFLPTGETALFVLAGGHIGQRVQYMTLFEESHFFSKHNIMHLEPAPVREPAQSGALAPTPEFLAYFTTVDGNYFPKFSAQFPAQRVTTPLLGPIWYWTSIH